MAYVNTPESQLFRFKLQMAIQFARIEYVSRSSGGNACRKAAYNERTKVICERTGEVFSWKGKLDLSYHEILLPEGATSISY